MIASLAAAGALVFGAGPIVSKPDLSWRDNALQLIVAVVAGTVGIVALVLLIGLLAKVLAPQKVVLESIPKDMKAEIDSSPHERLPADANNYDQFLKNYYFYRAAAKSLESRLASLPSAPAQGTPELLERRQVRALLDDIQHNLDVYTSATASYLDQAEYYGVANLFGKTRWRAVVLAILAAVGALVFQLALATPKKPTEPKSSPTYIFVPKPTPIHIDMPKPVLAYIDVPQRYSQFWNELDLACCAIESRVPVILEKGIGSDDDPYRVTTIAVAPHCQSKSFNFTGGQLTLHRQNPIQVTPGDH